MFDFSTPFSYSNRRLPHWKSCLSFIFRHISKYFRSNDRIRVPTVRLINEKEEQVGIVAIEKALELAKAVELDLVEVAPKAHPPVCKIMDFGKYSYQQKKTEQKHKRQQKQAEVKGIRLSFRIDSHDLATKAARAKEFLSNRNLVKVTMILRGREMAHLDMARQKMFTFADSVADTAKMEEPPKKTGNSIIMMLSPLK